MAVVVVVVVAERQFHRLQFSAYDIAKKCTLFIGLKRLAISGKTLGNIVHTILLKV